ncbi:tRNA dihydrouridine synthase DusB [Candidatus Woesearchaeota archaeon]|nr:tRNA dihydrouridine synthase DusB [Candidatus Woesearchaeota archaeon]
MVYSIGHVRLKNRFILAPMAGITDIAFRVLCRRYGAALVCSEMVNPIALIRENREAVRKASVCTEEKPVAVQLFGADARLLAKAASIVEKKGADIIDLNLGCPDIKVRKQGAGSALLKHPDRIRSIIRAMVKAVGIPVTAKIRIQDSNSDLHVAEAVQSAGAAAIAVHARTSSQMYSGKADLEAVRNVKENVSVPVIGNGDVQSRQDAEDMFRATGCDFVMVGRAAMGNPAIFAELQGNKVIPKHQMFAQYLELAEKCGCIDKARLKVHSCNFTKGLKGSARLRQRITSSNTVEDIKECLCFRSF